MKEGLIYRPIGHVLLILILGFLAYSNTFNVPFHFDDHSNIVKNPVIKNPLGFIFESEFKGNRGHMAMEAPSGRTIAMLTFGINYMLHGLDVTGYHIGNLLIHIINAIFVYLILRLILFNIVAVYEVDLKKLRTIQMTAFFTSLLFLLHPLQTQAVTYIVQRMASLAALFFLVSFLFYLHLRILLKQQRESGPQVKSNKWIYYYIPSLLFAVLAMKTKENAFTLPFVIIIFDFIFFQDEIKQRLKYLFPFVLTIFIIPIDVIRSQKSLGALMSSASNDGGLIVWNHYLYTQFSVIVKYIRLIFIPMDQNLIHYHYVYKSLFAVPVLLSIGFLLSIIGGAFYLLKRFGRTSSYIPLISFGIFWFFVTLSVESSIIPIADVIFEHRVYLPSVGVFIAFVSFVFLLLEKFEENNIELKKWMVRLMILLIPVLAILTFNRNVVWKDHMSLWKDVTSKNSVSAVAQNNMGNCYFLQGDFPRALIFYQQSLELNPNYMIARQNLQLVQQRLLIIRGNRPKPSNH